MSTIYSSITARTPEGLAEQLTVWAAGGWVEVGSVFPVTVGVATQGHAILVKRGSATAEKPKPTRKRTRKATAKAGEK